MRRYSPGMAILVGGLIAGTLDITYAITYSAWRGTPPQALLQFVASGLLGQPSFEGGTGTAALGLLLHYLMMHQGRVISRTELVEHLYDQDFDRDSNTIEVFIGRLRKKIGPDRIETVRGLGYRLAPLPGEPVEG